MKKLTKGQIAEKGILSSKLADARAKLQEALEQYNVLLQEAEDFRGQVAQDLENWCDLRSEKWLESDAGQAFLEFKDAWEQELETGVEVDDNGTPEAWDELPEEVAS